MIMNNKRLIVYTDGLIHSVFKILPLYEEKNTGLNAYVDSLIRGLFELDEVVKIEDSFEYFSLLNTVKAAQTEILSEESEHRIVRREVLKAISIIKIMTYKLNERR